MMEVLVAFGALVGIVLGFVTTILLIRVLLRVYDVLGILAAWLEAGIRQYDERRKVLPS